MILDQGELYQVFHANNKEFALGRKIDLVRKGNLF
jgi:hypothetical protein